MAFWKNLFRGSTPIVENKPNVQNIDGIMRDPPAPKMRMEIFIEALTSDFPRFRDNDLAWWRKVWSAVGDGDRDFASLRGVEQDFTLITIDLPDNGAAEDFMLSLSFAKRTSRGIELDAHVWAVRSLGISDPGSCALLLSCRFLPSEVAEVVSKASARGYRAKMHSFGENAKSVIERAKRLE